MARPCSEGGFGCTSGFLLGEPEGAAGETRPVCIEVGTSGSMSSSSRLEGRVEPLRDDGLADESDEDL